MKSTIETLCKKHDFEFNDTRKIISLKESKSEYTAKNNQEKEVAHFKIDNGLMKGAQGKQCDHLLLVDNGSCDWYFIELKDGAGLQPNNEPNKKLEEALNQLQSAIQYMKSEQWLKTPSAIESRIVSWRIPNVGPTSKSGYRSLEKKYKQINLKFRQSENI